MSALRIGVLASGAGTNLQAILDRLHGRGAVEVVGVAVNRPEAAALDRARTAGVAASVFPLSSHGGDRAARDAAMAAWLLERQVSLVVMAGYMQIVTAAFLEAFPDRVINVHPSLLPAFPGVRAIEQALDYGVQLFGVTVHLVDGGVDSGRIIAQESVALPGVTDPVEVHDRLRPIEHRLLCGAIADIASGRVRRDPDHERRMLVG